MPAGNDPAEVKEGGLARQVRILSKFLSLIMDTGISFSVISAMFYFLGSCIEERKSKNKLVLNEVVEKF